MKTRQFRRWTQKKKTETNEEQHKTHNIHYMLAYLNNDTLALFTSEAVMRPGTCLASCGDCCRWW